MKLPGVVPVFALCMVVLLALSAPPAIAQDATAPDQTPAAGATTTQNQPPAGQLPAPQHSIHFQGFEPLKAIESFSSPYIPLDSWIYPAMMRLYSLGYVDSEFLGMRPWTRLSVAHMLDESSDRINDSNDDEATAIYSAVEQELQPDLRIPLDRKYGRVRLDSAYTRVMGIAGLPLRDSFHFGQTDINDFGRPYAGGFNSYTGMSALAQYGRFSMYFRGEYQHAPSWAGYSSTVATILADIDGFDTDGPVALPGNTTIPLGPIASVNNLTVLEGYVSAHLLGNEISFGKMDNWYGPGTGGGMAWSNNAENIYSFRINRVEPLYIPYISRIAGSDPLRFFCRSPQGPQRSREPVGAFGKDLLQNHAELRIRLRANGHLGWERPRADNPGHFLAKLLQHQRYKRRGKEFAPEIRARASARSIFHGVCPI